MKNLGEALLRSGILRLFLAIMVVLHHAQVCALGAWAVNVFFILSGYWVCRMWWEKYRDRPHGVLVFLAGRFWRLWPVYIICNLIGLAVIARFDPHCATEAAIMGHPAWIARTLMIVSAGSQYDPVPPIWSLDIEMQFYLVLPLLAWVVFRIFGLPPAWRSVVLAVALAGLALLFYRQAFAENAILLLPRFFGFFALGMITFFAAWKPQRWLGVGSALLFLAALAVMLGHPDWRHLLGGEATRPSQVILNTRNAALGGAFALLVLPYVAFTVAQPSPALDRHYGNLAYVLYLFHYPVQMGLDWISHALPASLLARGVLQTTILAVGTLALYRCVDLPSERWRHAILEKRRALPA